MEEKKIEFENNLEIQKQIGLRQMEERERQMKLTHDEKLAK